MLAQSWEAVAVELANAEEADVATLIETIAKKMKVDTGATPAPDAKVVIGRDTRPHSLHLASLAIEGVKSLRGIAEDVGVVTTPQLHHCVRSSNLKEEKGLASVEGYYTKLTEAFGDLVGNRVVPTPIIVDAAYGVGGPRFAELLAHLNRDKIILRCTIRNSPTGAEDKLEEEAAMLNNGIGAEHVQKGRQFPQNTLRLPDEELTRCASFDGDADRIVYYQATEEGDFDLYDGDKIACLYTFFIQKQLAALPEDLTKGIRLGCVQTAYANGASSKYIREELKVSAPLTKTGVKHLHHKALEFDIGVYFEANGHGTVLFKPSLITKLKDVQDDFDTDAEKRAVQNILSLEQLINQATGDAMADLLAVEAILTVEHISLETWGMMYRDLPSRQLKCQVADRTIIETTSDESRVIAPAALQDAIDAAVAKYTSGRAFARPSGTEDAVRVYAEAGSAEEADALALEVNQAIFDHAGGVGERPE